MDVIPKCYVWHLMCLATRKLSNKELYGNLAPVSLKVGFRRLKLAGHCVRHLEEEASKLVLWQPMSRRTNVGKPAVTHHHQRPLGAE